MAQFRFRFAPTLIQNGPLGAPYWAPWCTLLLSMPPWALQGPIWGHFGFVRAHFWASFAQCLAHFGKCLSSLVHSEMARVQDSATRAVARPGHLLPTFLHLRCSVLCLLPACLQLRRIDLVQHRQPRRSGRSPPDIETSAVTRLSDALRWLCFWQRPTLDKNAANLCMLAL